MYVLNNVHMNEGNAIHRLVRWACNLCLKKLPEDGTLVLKHV